MRGQYRNYISSSVVSAQFIARAKISRVPSNLARGCQKKSLKQVTIEENHSRIGLNNPFPIAHQHTNVETCSGEKQGNRFDKANLK
jgi:hypothetical protein